MHRQRRQAAAGGGRRRQSGGPSPLTRWSWAWLSPHCTWMLVRIGITRPPPARAPSWRANSLHRARPGAAAGFGNRPCPVLERNWQRESCRQRGAPMPTSGWEAPRAVLATNTALGLLQDKQLHKDLCCSARSHPSMPAAAAGGSACQLHGRLLHTNTKPHPQLHCKLYTGVGPMGRSFRSTARSEASTCVCEGGRHRGSSCAEAKGEQCIARGAAATEAAWPQNWGARRGGLGQCRAAGWQGEAPGTPARPQKRDR